MKLLVIFVGVLGCPTGGLGGACPEPPAFTPYTSMTCGSKAGHVSRDENWIDRFHDYEIEAEERRLGGGGGGYGGGYGYGYGYYQSGTATGVRSAFRRVYTWFVRLFDWFSTSGSSQAEQRSSRAVYHSSQDPIPRLQASAVESRSDSNSGVDRGEAPFNVLLQVFCPATGWRTCTGTVINEGNVLTAAHCLVDRHEACSGGYAVAGKTRDGSAKPGSRGQTKLFESFSYHENWNPNRPSGGYDIAIVYPSGGFVLDDFLQPICIPDSDGDDIGGCNNYIFDSEVARDRRDLSLRKVSAIVLGSCSALGALLPGDHRLCVQESQAGRRSCREGGSSPLVTEYDGKFFQTGIESSCSSDTGSGTGSIPFTRVSRFAAWIRANLK